MKLSRVALLFGVVAVGGCGSATSPTDEDCSVLGEVSTVRDILRDVYFWYRELPDPNPRTFSSPEEYLDAVRYKTLDKTYSYITDRAESDAFFSESQTVGFGFVKTLNGNDDLRVLEVYAGSAAADAGLQRGSRILTVDGRTIAQIQAAEGIDDAFGARQAGVARTLKFLDRAGSEHTVTMVKRAYTIPPVAMAKTYAVGSRVVGYVVLEAFVEPADPALDTAFQTLRAQGANEMVLDVRYNGGGLVSVAQHLSGLIGGTKTAGQVFVHFEHNDKHRDSDSIDRFPAASAQSLSVDRLMVIATQGTASASELMINGLRPFMNVTVVGDRTYGKPVGQYGHDFCDKTLFDVEFATRNARDEGGYFDGIPVDCPAPDDIGHELGDAQEASLATALNVIRTGRCSGTAAAEAQAQSLRRPAGARPLTETGPPLMVRRPSAGSRLSN
jgi:C-terminal processing protease CtpA/Prc